MEEKRYGVIIVGAGGIGRAAGLLLRELGDFEVEIFIGDGVESAAQKSAEWILKNSTKNGNVEPFVMPLENSNEEFNRYLKKTDIILDCLPGSQAPRIARLARQYNLHYANLSEHVKETNEVMAIAQGAERGFVLQTGLAPGFINVLANHLYLQFAALFKVEQVESISMKVGALTQNAYPPTYYGFTWSAVGVATLYVKPAKLISEFETTKKASLTERSKIILNGIEFEEDLTSGGAADLPESLAGKTRNLSYKTLRYPGHFEWIDNLLRQIPHGEDRVEKLQQKMEELVPLVEEDMVVIYASVLGYDPQGNRRLLEKSYFIKPVHIGGKQLRAIQATTAASLAESARILLYGHHKGCILQSQIDSDAFLNGPFVSTIYKQ